MFSRHVVLFFVNVLERGRGGMRHIDGFDAFTLLVVICIAVGGLGDLV